jgi:hypothetical protein
MGKRPDVDRHNPKFRLGADVEAFAAIASWLQEERERLQRLIKLRALALGWNADDRAA